MAHGIIISLGSVNADFQVRVDEKPGNTTTLLGHDFLRLSGGKGANVAYLACHLGASSALIAHVGDDDLQEQALKPLREKGIDLKRVKSVKNQSTGVSMIAVSPDGKKQIILAPNANDVWEESDGDQVQEALDMAPEGSVLVVDYEVAAFIVERAIKAARKKNLPIILDPSPYDRVDRKLLSQVDYLVPDASETEGLTGILPDSVEKAKKAALKLLKEGVANVLVKMKDGGCVAATKELIILVPLFRRRR